MAARSADNSSKPRPDAGQLRALSAEVVASVQSGASLDTALPNAQVQLRSAQDRALLQALSFGVLRDLRLLQDLLAQLLDRPVADDRLQALLLTGLYQLRSLRIPAHAAVSETVAAATRIGQPRARGLVNAVLRRYLREHAALEQSRPDSPAIRYSHPDWLVTQLRIDWPSRWEEILAANQSPGPMSLRVNARRTTPDDYLEKLRQAGIVAQVSVHAPQALTLTEPVPVERLPGFFEGLVSVQDLAAQQAAQLLALQPGLRVLDACAAPGGKSAHILELADVDLVALDKDPRRLHRVQETFERLGLDGQCRAVNACDTHDWWDGRPFDRILIDAPCSGTGVIRRHPDIKWLRHATDIPVMAAVQRRMLETLWPLLAPDGLLVYATCSLLSAEGEGVVHAFVRETPSAQVLEIDAEWGESCGAGRRIATGEAGMDSFYYVRLRRAG